MSLLVPTGLGPGSCTGSPRWLLPPLNGQLSLLTSRDGPNHLGPILLNTLQWKPFTSWSPSLQKYCISYQNQRRLITGGGCQGRKSHSTFTNSQRVATALRGHGLCTNKPGLATHPQEVNEKNQINNEKQNQELYSICPHWKRDKEIQWYLSTPEPSDSQPF